MFGIDFFQMNSATNNLRQIENTRWFAVLLPQTFPQLAIQFIYASIVGWDNIINEPIFLMAICQNSIYILGFCILVCKTIYSKWLCVDNNRNKYIY